MDLETIQIAALLHDIGKFYQRTKQSHDESYKKYVQSDFGQTGAHGKWSADFVKEIWGDDVEDLVLYHHNPKKSNYPEMANIITKADHHSSAERLHSEEKQIVWKEPLISIFSRVKFDDKKEIKEYYLPMKKLTLNSESFKRMEPKDNKKEVIKGADLRPEYKNLWIEFNFELKKLKNINDFNTILALLRKYTSTMPSAAYLSKPDISLFDHSKTTAALATCRYLFNKDGNKKLKKTVDDQEVYLTISGDISGIQKFIYRIFSPQKAQSGMSKRLRGRSLYINLFSDAIVNRIVEKLNLTQANVLFCGGGRFTILAPNTEKAIKNLKKVKKDVNRICIDKFNSELYLALSYLPCSGKNMGNFGEITEELSDLLEEDKKHKFLDELNEVFEIKEVKHEKTCSVCGNETENNICKECKSHEDLGKKVANANYMIKCYLNYNNEFSNHNFDFYEESFNVGYLFKKSSNTFKLSEDVKKLANKYDRVEAIKLNDTNFLELIDDIDSKNVSFSFSFLGNIVPRYSTDPLYFEHLAKISNGADKLGVLKMDVDNLGLIFSKGFDNLEETNNNNNNNNNKDILKKGGSISRISTLSSSLDIFFSGFINEIAKNYRVFKKCCDKCKDKLEPIELKRQKNENLQWDVSQFDHEFDKRDLPFTVFREKHGKVCDECKKTAIPTILINYSGGDDLLVLGPYDDIIRFAREFREKFKEWTCNNPHITLSGGISIVGPKFPIGKAADLSESYLNASKNCGKDKDKITVFGEVVKWDDSGSSKGFNELFKYGQKLEEYVSDEKLSKGIVYSMLRLWQNNFPESNRIFTDEEEWCNDNIMRLSRKKFVPMYKYKLRLVKDKKTREYLDKDGLKVMPWIKIPVSWLSLRMR